MLPILQKSANISLRININMQKNLFLGFLVLSVIAIGSFAYAKTVEVVSYDSFSTANPPSSVNIQLLDNLEISAGTIIPTGAEINGKLVDVVSPKRFKKNATFSFQPEWYIVNGSKHNLEGTVKAKYTTALDKAGIAKNAALSVGNHFVKGLTMEVAAVQGAIKNEEGNPIKSGAKSMYEASPLSYSEKGSDIEIKQNQVFYLKFPDISKK